MKNIMQTMIGGVVAWIVLFQTAKADYLEAFCGNTRFGPAVDSEEDPVVGGVISFAVWECTDGDWFDDLGTGGNGIDYDETFNQDGFRDLNGSHLFLPIGPESAMNTEAYDKSPLLDEEGNKIINPELVGLNRSHRYVYMYQVVRDQCHYAITSLRLPHAYGLCPNGIAPSVGAVRKWNHRGIDYGNSGFKITPFALRDRDENRLYTVGDDATNPTEARWGLQLFAEDSARVGWTKTNTTSALGMQLEQRFDPDLGKEQWYVQAPSRTADVPGDGVPSHTGTMPVNFSGFGGAENQQSGNNYHFPTGVTRDAENGTLEVFFDPLVENYGVSSNTAHANKLIHASTCVFFMTSDQPPTYQAATLLSADDSFTQGDLPVATEQ